VRCLQGTACSKSLFVIPELSQYRRMVSAENFVTLKAGERWGSVMARSECGGPSCARISA